MFLTMMALSLAVQQCPRNVELPRGLAGWARSGEGLDTRHATVLAVRGGRAEARMKIRKAGVFGIAIGREGWIDVTPARGRKLRMASESRGPRCSGIRKIVRYRLRPGDYRVSIGKIGGDRVRVMLVRGGGSR